jgi:hypothetical protein
MNEFEQEQELENQDIMSRAKSLNREQMDLVKKMNQKVDYAKTVTIRDRQLELKKEEFERFREEEKRKDLIMEIERLKMIQFYEKEQERKRQSILKGREVIIEQIKERALNVLKQKEEMEKEGQAVIKKTREIEREEQEHNLERKRQQKQLND